MCDEVNVAVGAGPDVGCWVIYIFIYINIYNYNVCVCVYVQTRPEEMHRKYDLVDALLDKLNLSA